MGDGFSSHLWLLTGLACRSGPVSITMATQRSPLGAQPSVTQREWHPSHNVTECIYIRLSGSEGGKRGHTKHVTTLSSHHPCKEPWVVFCCVRSGFCIPTVRVCLISEARVRVTQWQPREPLLPDTGGPGFLLQLLLGVFWEQLLSPWRPGAAGEGSSSARWGDIHCSREKWAWVHTL